MSRSIILFAVLALALQIQVLVQAAGTSTPLRIQSHIYGLYARLDVESLDRSIVLDTESVDEGRLWELEYSYPDNNDVFLIRNWNTGERITGRVAENSALWGGSYEQSEWERILVDEANYGYVVQLVGTNLVWTLTDDHRVVLANRTAGAQNQNWEFQILV